MFEKNNTHNLLEKLRSNLESFSNQNKLKLFLSFDDLNGGHLSINGDIGLNALSTIKVEVMVETFNQLENGSINFTDQVERYGYVGTVAEALDAMMVNSSNEATGALILKVGGVAKINSTLKTYLGENSQTLVSHTPGFAEGGKNISTMNEQAKLLRLIYEGKIVNIEASRQMISLMYRCFDYFEIKTLSEIAQIAQKTGYAPPIQFGVTSLVQLKSGIEYITSFQIMGDGGEDIEASLVKEIFEIVNSYL